MSVRKPCNLEEIRYWFDALPAGSRIKLAKKYNVTPRYITELTKPYGKAYNYAIIKDAMAMLPEEIRQGLKLEFK